MTATERKRRHTPHQPVGRWIRSKTRLAIYLRDGFRCLLCGRDLHGADPAEVTLDHVRPVSDGGTNEPDNLFTCCRGCNSSRRSLALAAYLSTMIAAIRAIYWEAVPEQPLGYDATEIYRRIKNHCRRKLDRYRRLARALLTEVVSTADRSMAASEAWGRATQTMLAAAERRDGPETAP